MYTRRLEFISVQPDSPGLRSAIAAMHPAVQAFISQPPKKEGEPIKLPPRKLLVWPDVNDLLKIMAIQHQAIEEDPLDE